MSSHDRMEKSKENRVMGVCLCLTSRVGGMKSRSCCVVIEGIGAYVKTSPAEYEGKNALKRVIWVTKRHSLSDSERVSERDSKR